MRMEPWWSWGRARLAGLAALCALVLALWPRGSGAQERATHPEHGAFTSDERAHLTRGELVSRPHRPGTADGWLGGVGFQVIDRPTAEVWRALEDLDAYQYMLPGTDLTRDEGPEGGARVLYVHQAQMGIEVSYCLRLHLDAVGRRVEFELDRDRPHDVEDARGFLELQSFHRTRTLVTWAVCATLGMGAVEPMIRGVVEPWLLRVPSTMKSYLEGQARDRYRG